MIWRIMPYRMDKENIRKLVASGMSSKAIAADQGVTKKRVLAFVVTHNLGPWVSRTKTLKHTKRPVPDDFYSLAPTMTMKQAQEHYGCGGGVVARWYRETGIRSASASVIAPADFADMVTGLTYSEAGLKLGVSRDVATRLMKAAGIDPPKAFRAPPPPLNKPKVSFKPSGPTLALDRIQRDMTVTGQAVDFLRRIGPVWRCAERGKPDVDGQYWRRGSAVLTGDEVVERATRLGFRYVTV